MKTTKAHAKRMYKGMTECKDKRIVNDRFRMPSEDDRCEWLRNTTEANDMI